jgi:hypothetical protein
LNRVYHSSFFTKGENIMKRFTVLTALFSISVFGLWAVSQAALEPGSSAPITVYDATGAMLEAIHSGDKVSIAPVYDSTGAMLAVINPNTKVTTVPAYDATGAMLQAIHAQAAAGKFIPVYDATGAMLEAINP